MSINMDIPSTVLQIESLPFRERFLIWAIRISFSSDVSNDDTHSALKHAFRLSHIPFALPCFNQYTHVIASTLLEHHQTIDLNPPACPGVGRDEWHLMQVIAALQARDRLLAHDYLVPLVPTTAIRTVCNSGHHLAQILSRMNFVLRRTGLPITTFVQVRPGYSAANIVNRNEVK